MNPLKKCTAIKFLLVLAALCASTWVHAAPMIGTVTQLSGPMLAKKSNGTMRVLGVKSAVDVGDTLSTQGRAYAQIKFSDDSVLILQPDTVLTIDKFSYEAGKPAVDSIAFTLMQGGVRSNAGLLGKRSKDRVQLVTPSANIDMGAANVVVQYIKPNDETVAAAREAYLLASTAALDISMQATRSDIPAISAIQPLMLAQNLPAIPRPPGTSSTLAPGLYVHVIDGLINISNKGGSLSFTAGQFGYTPNPMQPPAIVPKNPGLIFTPPPTFIPSSSGSGGSQVPTKSNTVECEVR